MKRLIVFVKNPVAGKVKTRLAKDIGDQNALKVYHELLAITLDAIQELDAEVAEHRQQSRVVWGRGRRGHRRRVEGQHHPHRA